MYLTGNTNFSFKSHFYGREMKSFRSFWFIYYEIETEVVGCVALWKGTGRRCRLLYWVENQLISFLPFFFFRSFICSGDSHISFMLYVNVSWNNCFPLFSPAPALALDLHMNGIYFRFTFPC